MNDYAKGILTGASLILCFFILVSAKSQSKNLGDIEVTSLRVVDENGEMVGSLDSYENSGFLMLSRGRQIGVAMSVDDNGGVIRMNNNDDKLTLFLGTSKNYRHGIINTYDANGKIATHLGTSIEAESTGGMLETFKPDGKKTTFLGTGGGGGGFLRIFNKHEVQTGYFGTGKNNDGIAVLFDRYGDVGWAEEGKK